MKSITVDYFIAYVTVIPYVSIIITRCVMIESFVSWQLNCLLFLTIVNSYLLQLSKLSHFDLLSSHIQSNIFYNDSIKKLLTKSLQSPY